MKAVIIGGQKNNESQKKRKAGHINIFRTGF
jgi:hypothetical protein